MEKRNVKIIVRGYVQGIGFRWFVLRLARQLALEGYVKNLSNGCVEIYASGEQEKISELIENLRSGPGSVDEVETFDAEPFEGNGFEIRF